MQKRAPAARIAASAFAFDRPSCPTCPYHCVQLVHDRSLVVFSMDSCRKKNCFTLPPGMAFYAGTQTTSSSRLAHID
eukprot:1159936-Pelagomonas_calceolata.AAC.13